MRRKFFWIFLLALLITWSVFGLNNGVLVTLPSDSLAAPDSTYLLMIGLKNDGVSREVDVIVEGDLEVVDGDRKVQLSAYRSEEIRFVVKTRDIGINKITVGVSYGDEIFVETLNLRVSGLVSQMKDLLDYYSELAGVLRGRVTSEFYLETEDIISQAQDAYIQQDYEDLENHLETIRIKLEDVDETVFVVNRENGGGGSDEISSGTSQTIVLSIVIPLLLLILLGVFSIPHLGKTFIRARPKSKKELKKVRSSVKRRSSGSRLGRELEELNKRIKKLGYSPELKNIRVEYELVKEKHDKGMYRMCRHYLRDLEEKVGEMEGDKQS